MKRKEEEGNNKTTIKFTCRPSAAWHASVHIGTSTGGGNFFLKRFFFKVSSSGKNIWPFFSKRICKKYKIKFSIKLAHTKNKFN